MNTSSLDILLISGGDTAWMLSSSSLVMLMTPGLAFFYGGLVRGKNIINTMMMSFASLGLVTVQWTLLGYTLSFGGGNPIVGDFRFGGLKGVGPAPNPDYSSTIPHVLYSVYQLMFAIVTVAILSGGVAERMKFHIYLVFVFLWTTIVYDPIAHWLWSSYSVLDKNGIVQQHYGWLKQLGALDFAGGNVVHISAGVSAMVAAIIVGPRLDVVRKKKNKKTKPAHLPYVLLGGSVLWFGWFGFNGGSSLSAGVLAVYAVANTQVSTAMALMTWMFLDMWFKGTATVEGTISGAVVGLVAITPCAGYVHPQSSLAIGAIASLVTYFSVVAKSKFFPRYFPQIDDHLDVFSCHAIGGIVGAILLGFFSSKSINPLGGDDGVFFGNPYLLAYQLAAIAATTAWSAFFTAAILFPLKFTVGLAVTETALRIGLDRIFHGEAQVDLGADSSTARERVKETTDDRRTFREQVLRAVTENGVPVES